MEYISSEEYMSGTLHSMESEGVRMKQQVNDIEGRVSLLEEKVSRLWEKGITAWMPLPEPYQKEGD